LALYILPLSCKKKEESLHGSSKGHLFKNADFTFAVYGNTYKLEAANEHITKLISLYKPDILFHTGNIVGDVNSEDNWEKFFRGFAPLSGLISRFYLVPGEMDMRDAKTYKARFPNTAKLIGDELFYSLEYKNALFLILNSFPDNSKVYIQQKFIIDKIKSFILRKNGPVFAFTHHPIYSTGASGMNQFLARNYLMFLEHFATTIIFSGKDKIYGRYKTGNDTPTYCVVVSSSGDDAGKCRRTPIEFIQYECVSKSAFVYVGVKGRDAVVNAIDINGRIIDSFSVKSSLRYFARRGLKGVYRPF
jgi:hypothetical protein